MTALIRTLFAVLVVLALTAANVSAEVMDKQPSATENWIWSAAGGLVAIAAWRWRSWAGLVVTPLALMRLLAVYLDLRDPFIGPAMRLEAGDGYVTQFYLAAALAVALNILAVSIGVRGGRAA